MKTGAMLQKLGKWGQNPPFGLIGVFSGTARSYS